MTAAEKRAELRRMKKELEEVRAEIAETKELRHRLATIEQRIFYADTLAAQIAELEGGEQNV